MIALPPDLNINSPRAPHSAASPRAKLAAILTSALNLLVYSCAIGLCVLFWGLLAIILFRGCTTARGDDLPDPYIPYRWTVNVEAPHGEAIPPIARGETIALEIDYLTYGQPLGLGSVTDVQLRYRSRDMAANHHYAIAGAVVTNNRVRIIWTPSAEAPADRYIFDVLLQGSAASMRANGTIALTGHISGTQTDVPRVYETIDWIGVINQNTQAAPFPIKAPIDGQIYALQNDDWVVVETTGMTEEETQALIDAITPASIGASPTGHLHQVSDVTGLQTALDGKLPKTAGADHPLTGLLYIQNATGTRVSDSETEREIEYGPNRIRIRQLYGPTFQQDWTFPHIETDGSYVFLSTADATYQAALTNLTGSAGIQISGTGRTRDISGDDLLPRDGSRTVTAVNFAGETARGISAPSDVQLLIHSGDRLTLSSGADGVEIIIVESNYFIGAESIDLMGKRLDGSSAVELGSVTITNWTQLVSQLQLVQETNATYTQAVALAESALQPGDVPTFADLDHALLANNNWVESGHTSTPDSLAAFDNEGKAATLVFGTMIAEDATDYYTAADTDAAISTNRAAIPTADSITTDTIALDLADGLMRHVNVETNVTTITIAGATAGTIAGQTIIIQGAATHSVGGWPAGLVWGSGSPDNITNAWHRLWLESTGTNLVIWAAGEGADPL